MKPSLLSSFTAALLGAVSLFSLSAMAKPSDTPVRLRVELDRPVLPAGSTQRAVVKVALDCDQPVRTETHPPVNLTLVLDRSGSMQGDKLENAKNAAVEAVRRLGPDDVFSFVIFDHEVETLVPACRVGSRHDLETRIRSVVARGNTAIYAGVNQGAAELRKNLEDRRYTHRMLLLSDGLANNGPSQPNDFARLGAALIREGISVSTIGLGTDYNEDLMTRLALKSDGNTYFVSSSRDLPKIFNAELGDVMSVVARRVVVTIEFPAHVRPLAFVGREGTIRGQHAEFSLNQLYGGQEKFALVEVEVDSAKPGEEREIARANVAFEDALSRRAANASARSAARFTAVEKEVVAAVNQTVQVDYATNSLAAVKDEAVALADAGRKDEAAMRLREWGNVNSAAPAASANGALQSLLTANGREAERLQRDGLSNEQRKLYRTENAQATSQQTSGASRP